MIITREIEVEAEDREPDEATLSAYHKALAQQAEIEQRAINQLRELLTFKQRSLIATQ